MFNEIYDLIKDEFIIKGDRYESNDKSADER